MHDTAQELGALFFNTYLDERARFILDVGAMDINGSIRDRVPSGCVYVGVDLQEGPGVDIVLDDVYTYPFRDEYFDAVCSTSCFEHSEFFWLIFLEMVRVTKRNGYIYINCPSNGEYHPYPSDNWRFYPDAGVALQNWARYNRIDIALVESFVAFRKDDQWNDCVMVFCKAPAEDLSVQKLISDTYRCYNVRRYDRTNLQDYSRVTEDMILLAEARASDRAAHFAAPEEVAVVPQVDLQQSLDIEARRIAAVQQQLALLSVSLDALHQRSAKIGNH